MISTPSNKLLRALALIAALVALALPASAVAQSEDPTGAQYDDPITKVNDEVGGAGDGDGSGPAAADAEASGLQREVVNGLPFTGLDAMAMALVALALTTMGFALRRLTFTGDS